CPYGNINIHNFTVTVEDEARPGRRKAVVREKATTCDLCHDLKEPSCVYACPHGAAMRVEPLAFFADKLGLTRECCSPPPSIAGSSRRRSPRSSPPRRTSPTRRAGSTGRALAAGRAWPLVSSASH